MTRFDTNLRMEWRAMPATDRWHALQSQLSQLSRTTATAATAWMRRSPPTCKWRALPAGVSTLVTVTE